MKGVSPLISMVILIVIVVGIAAMIGPWALSLVSETIGQVGTGVEQSVTCRNLAYDFDTSFSGDGIDDTTFPTSLIVRIRNTGLVNIYGFSFEIESEDDAGTIYFNSLAATDTTQVVGDNPLKPRESAIIEADTTGVTGTTLKQLKVLNGLNCPAIVKTFAVA